ncbi:MAG: DnaA/Hda family protein [Phycisphaerales bacterium]|nr:DnaA/Hda family protein [Phycisphaerales bacterium]
MKPRSSHAAEQPQQRDTTCSSKGPSDGASGRTVSADEHAQPLSKRAARQSSSKGASKKIARTLEDRLGTQKYDMWFAHARLDIEGNCLNVITNSQFTANWIDKNFAADLKQVAQETIGETAEILVSFAPHLFEDSSPGSTSSPSTSAEDRAEAPQQTEQKKSSRGDRGWHQWQDRDDSPSAPPPARWGTSRDGHLTAAGSPLPRHSSLRPLEHFIVGKSNQLAYAAAIRLSSDPNAASHSPLFIHGECGVGKTHLLQGVCRKFLQSCDRPDAVRYVTGEQFTNEYIAAVRTQTLDAFRQRHRRLDLLAIDDVHFLSNKVRTQSEFLHTLDAIDLTGSRIVLASDEHPRHIKRFSNALISRFLSGMVVCVDRPDRETRRRLIVQLANQRGLRINDAAIDMITGNCVGSVRELEGAITKLGALQSIGKQDSGGEQGTIGRLLAEQLFKGDTWQPSTPVRIGTIMQAVCDRLTISQADLIGSSRQRTVTLARGVVAYMGRKMTALSYPEIAQALGRSYHSTIHTAAKRIAHRIEAEDRVDIPGEAEPIDLRELTDQLRHEVRRQTSSLSS